MSEKNSLLDYIKEPLVFVNATFDSHGELFEEVYQQAVKRDWVTTNFIDKINERETTFPTGIQLEKRGAAIPHTDPECVKQEFIAIVTNQKPVSFMRMDDANQSVAAEIVFVLGLNQPHAQLEMLQSLMGLLQNETVLTQLINSQDVPSLIQIVKQYSL
ncbi:MULTISPECIES: PTS sugar transporter subunit IIA [Enterococcus]|uniref:PTS sugar transporter subunit IIA n=1 Tax=Enterococcus sp. AZ103 TaxID=2774628 RepID=UPI003F273241